MKIALVVPGFSRHAADWAIPALQSLACYLARTHQLHVFSLRYPAAGRYHFCGLAHHASGGSGRMGLASPGIVLRTVQAIAAEHRRSPFDLLHAFWVDEPAFAAVLAGRLLRRPVLASTGGGELVYLADIAYGTQGSPWRRWLIRFALSQATLVTAGSLYQQQLCLQAGVPRRKTVVAPLGVDGDRFRPGPVPEGPPLLVQAASLVPVKQQTLLLEVLAYLLPRLPAARLLLAGAGPEQERLAAHAAALGLAEAVTWAGRQPHPRMPAIYRRGHLYLQSSRHESQGMAVLEAMACGLPVLGTPVGLLPEVAARPPTADPGLLAGQALALLEDPALRARAGRAARALVESHFSLPVTAAGFLDLYQRLLAGRPAVATSGR